MIIHSIRTEIFETLSDDMLPEDDGLQKMMKNRLANLTLPVLNVQNKENLQETIDRKITFLS